MSTHILIAAALLLAPIEVRAQSIAGGALSGDRYRVIVSTDIGGTDPDDFQSMVHLLLYADCFDLEALISSPYGPGRKEHILRVIEAYERDYPALIKHSDRFPTADRLREITHQGEKAEAPLVGYRQPTAGSECIIASARRSDPRPVYVLVWGGLEDLTQALHDAPDILPKLRVYWIGGPNKKWSVNAYQYLVAHHPTLWMIEANATYRGWFLGGNQSGQWGNTEFVKQHVAGHGALGNYFAEHLTGTIKMGDTPSVAWLLRGEPTSPNKLSWGGQFVRAWDRPYLKLNRLPHATDRLEEFGILEIALPIKSTINAQSHANIVVEGQRLPGHFTEDGELIFRFSPKASKTYDFVIESNVLEVKGRSGTLTTHHPAAELRSKPSQQLPNWWTDDPAIELMEGPHIGAKSVNRWREEFLSDFAQRMQWCDRS